MPSHRLAHAATKLQASAKPSSRQRRGEIVGEDIETRTTGEFSWDYFHFSPTSMKRYRQSSSSNQSFEATTMIDPHANVIAAAVDRTYELALCRLIIVISFPTSLKTTSSINMRMRRRPRPLHFPKLAGSRGSLNFVRSKPAPSSRTTKRA